MSSSSQFPPQGAKVPPQGINVDQQLTDQFRENYKASSKKSSPIINKMGQTVNTAATDSRLIGSATGKELSGRVSLVLDNLLAVGSYVLSSIAATASRIFGFSENPGLKKELSPEQKAVGRENIQKTGEMFGVDLGLKATPKKAAEPAPKPVTEQKRRETIIQKEEAEAIEVANKMAEILKEVEPQIAQTTTSPPASATPAPAKPVESAEKKSQQKLDDMMESLRKEPEPAPSTPPTLSAEEKKAKKYIDDSVNLLKKQAASLNLKPSDPILAELNGVIEQMQNLASTYNPRDPYSESRVNTQMRSLNEQWEEIMERASR